MLEEKYRFIRDGIYLIAQVDEKTGKQRLIMRQVDISTGETITEENIDCIHTAISDITAEEFIEDSPKNDDENEEFLKKMLNIRSSENIAEIHLSIEEKFQAFKSWVQGIAEADEYAFIIQSELESYAHLMYPIANVLLKFIAMSIPDFIPTYLLTISKECQYEGVKHEASLLANIFPIVHILAENYHSIKEDEMHEILDILLEIGLPEDYFISDDDFAKLIGYLSFPDIIERLSEKFLHYLKKSGLYSHVSLQERLSLFAIQLITGSEIALDTSLRSYGATVKNNHVYELSCNALTSLPYFVENLIYLEKMIIQYLRNSTLPHSIGSLIKLKFLNFNSSSITKLPDSFGNLIELETLLGMGCHLNEIPDTFTKLKSLKELNLYNNRLKFLPDSFGDLKSLVKLNLGNNKIIKLPDSFGSLKSLEEFHFLGNELENLPESFCNLNHLKVLDLEMNEIIELPKDFGKLSNLEIFRINNNKLSAIPDSIGDLTNLTHLNISNNKLDSLPKNITSLKNLKFLSIGANDYNLTENQVNWMNYLKKNGCMIYR